MELFRKAFLFLVGAATIAVEETVKSIGEAAKSVEDQREKILPIIRRTTKFTNQH